MEFIFNLFAIIDTWKKYNLQKTGNEFHMWLSKIVHKIKIVPTKKKTTALLKINHKPTSNVTNNLVWAMLK